MDSLVSLSGQRVELSLVLCCVHEEEEGNEPCPHIHLLTALYDLMFGAENS